MQIRTTMNYHLPPVRKVVIEKKKKTNVGKDAKKRKPFSCGNINWSVIIENGMDGAQKIKNSTSS